MMNSLREARAVRQDDCGTGEHVRHLIEQNLESIGPRRSLLLVTMAIVWASITVAIVVWALAKGVMETLWITLAIASGSPIDIAVAIGLWAFILLTVPLVRAGLGVWRKWQDERWEAKVALDQLEEQLFPGAPNTRHFDSPRERLAQRALEELERRVFGAPRQEDGACEARLKELAQHARRRPPD